jgi:hypothetical protein
MKLERQSSRLRCVETSLRNDDSNLYLTPFLSEKNGIQFQNICKTVPYSFVQTALDIGFVVKLEFKRITEV